MTDECGLDDLPPRMWEEQVIAEIPDKGYWVERHGLFQDIAPGVSLWGFTESAHAQVGRMAAWRPQPAAARSGRSPAALAHSF